MTRTAHDQDGAAACTIDLVSDRGKLDALADVLEACRGYADVEHRAVQERYYNDRYDVFSEWERLSRFTRETAELCHMARRLADGGRPAADTLDVIRRCRDVPGILAASLADPDADITQTADGIGGYMLHGTGHWEGID